MSESNFTPRPWVVDNTGLGVLRLSDLGTWIRIAECKPVPTVDGAGDHTISDDEAKRNAQLVSACPAMIRALELALPLLKAYAGSPWSEAVKASEYALKQATDKVGYE